MKCVTINHKFSGMCYHSSSQIKLARQSMQSLMIFSMASENLFVGGRCLPYTESWMFDQLFLKSLILFYKLCDHFSDKYF